MVLHQATHKPQCWFLYIDDTFVIELHGCKRLRDFTDHLNIQFTMETKRQYDSLSLKVEVTVFLRNVG
jgi:hypothetical protein